MKKETQQLVLMLIIGILLGVVIAQLWIGRGGGESELSAVKDEATELLATSSDQTDMVKEKTVSVEKHPEAVLISGKSVPANSRMGLKVEDQKAGKEVSVSGFTFVSPQWIAVYDDREGALGWILGAKRFLPGDTGGVIPLLRATEVGKKYYVLIHNDDGDLQFNKI